jgi:predicted TIM-barrel fold metal-dependent hydrolase
MIIDTHVHVISDDQRKYPRRADAQAWVRDTSGEILLALNREAGGDRTVLVQGFGAYECDNSYTADCARRYPDSFASVCIVQGDAPLQLSYWVRERGVSGVRLFTTIEPEPPLDHPLMLSLWTRAARYPDLHHDAVPSARAASDVARTLCGDPGGARPSRAAAAERRLAV